MVISFFTPIGNYDYGFYWYLYLDGTIAARGRSDRHPVHLGLPVGGAPVRHRGGARARRAVPPAPVLGPAGHGRRRPCATPSRRCEAVARADGARTTRAATPSRSPRTRLTRESEAQRGADPGRGRTWHIVNPESTNRSAGPSAYALHPEGKPDAARRRRAPSIAAPGDLRDQAPVGHPLRPGRALPGRRLRQPARRRGGPADLDRGRPALDEDGRTLTSSCGTRSA